MKLEIPVLAQQLTGRQFLAATVDSQWEIWGQDTYLVLDNKVYLHASSDPDRRLAKWQRRQDHTYFHYVPPCKTQVSYF